MSKHGCAPMPSPDTPLGARDGMPSWHVGGRTTSNEPPERCVESLLPVTVPAAFTTVTTPVVALVVVVIIVWLVVFLLVFLLIRGLATTFLSIPVSTTGETGVGTMPRKRRGRSSWCSPRAGAAVLVHFVSLNLVFQVLLQLYVFRAEAGMSQHGSSCVLDSKIIAKSATFKKWGVQLTQFSHTWTPFL